MARSPSIFQLTCLLAAVLAFAYADEPERLIGGRNAAQGEFPYAVSIKFMGHHRCGGAIISNYHILTAAHCLVEQRKMPSLLSVVTGTVSSSHGGQTHQVKKVFTHKYYTKWNNDIGIIQLAGPITFNRFQNKINLPTSNPAPSTSAVVAAWGATEPPPKARFSDALQKLYVKTVPKSECQKHHTQEIRDVMICGFSKSSEGTCGGDSGSPLVAKGEIIGVVSGGIPCARGAPDIYTNVHYLLPYINEVMSS